MIFVNCTSKYLISLSKEMFICRLKINPPMVVKCVYKLILTSSVISFSFATGFLSDTALLWVVHHFLSCLAALRRRCEELCEGIDEALGLVVEAQAALRQVIVPHRKKQPVVTRVTLAGWAGRWVGRGRALPPTTPAQLLEGPPRPVEKDRSQ